MKSSEIKFSTAYQIKMFSAFLWIYCTIAFNFIFLQNIARTKKSQFIITYTVLIIATRSAKCFVHVFFYTHAHLYTFYHDHLAVFIGCLFLLDIPVKFVTLIHGIAIFLLMIEQLIVYNFRHDIV
jgi:hypothetical protein